LRNDFLPDAIPGNDGDTLLGTQVRVHGRKLTQAKPNE
jgi:hypothetical protein